MWLSRLREFGNVTCAQEQMGGQMPNMGGQEGELRLGFFYLFGCEPKIDTSLNKLLDSYQ